MKDREQYINRIYFCKTCQTCKTGKECNICRSENIYFVILDVAYQIYSIFHRHSIREKILVNKNRKKFKETFSSCLDGSIYQDYLKKEQHDVTISLCLNTDGAPVVASKGLSLWPVIAKIVELPDIIGESLENLVFIGLWLDNMKPNCEVFMDKCVEAIVKAIDAPCLKKIGKFYLSCFFKCI